LGVAHGRFGDCAAPRADHLCDRPELVCQGHHALGNGRQIGMMDDERLVGMQEFLAAIKRGDDEVTEQLALRLTAADEPDLLALAATNDVDQRWWAVRGLAQAGTAAALPTLRNGLTDADATVRAAAALAFGYLYARDPEPVAAELKHVAALLGDDDGIVRQSASDALALCGDAAVPALGEVLRTSTHEGARTRAAAALRKIATMRAAALLYPLLNDNNHLVRVYAYEGLDEMGLLENVLVIP